MNCLFQPYVGADPIKVCLGPGQDTRNEAVAFARCGRWMRFLPALSMGSASGIEALEEYPSEEQGKALVGESMRDLMFVGITLMFFAISVAYVYACCRLR